MIITFPQPFQLTHKVGSDGDCTENKNFLARRQNVRTVQETKPEMGKEMAEVQHNFLQHIKTSKLKKS